MSGGVKKTNLSRTTKPRVGVLIDSAESFFNHRSIADLIDAADERQIDLLFFFGGSFEKGKGSGPRSYAFSIASPGGLDAIILLPHSIAPHNPSSASQAIASRFNTIPVYSLFGETPGYYSVLTKEDPSIAEMIRHLVKDHSYRKFSVLRGPNNDESVSATRLRTIERTLAESNLTVPPDLVIDGNFTMEDGKRAARHILTREEDPPEVLICLNDQMAIGAIQEFTNKGIAVPGDIAVVGFDDVEENASLPCSMTTINFPTRAMTSALMDRVMSDLSGTTSYTPDQVVIEANFMHRESCGCLSWLDKAQNNGAPIEPLDQTPSSPATLKRTALIRRSLEETVEDCLGTRDTTGFVEFINQTIATLSHSGELIESFMQTFATQWTVCLLRHQEFEDQSLINALFIDAFRLLLQVKLKQFAVIHANDQGSLHFYQKCNDLLANNMTTAEAIQGIGDNIPDLGIDKFFLVLLTPDNPQEGELRLAFRRGTRIDIADSNYPRFSVNQLICECDRPLRGHFGLCPIAYNGFAYGYILMSIENKHFGQFDMIQRLISQIIDTAIANDQLSSHIQTLTKTNDALSRLSMIDEFTGLFNRRALYLTGRNMFDQAIVAGQSSCFIFLDMDGLKKINDAFGHKDGDAAIQSLSSILKKNFREKDLVVRYGGDEFVVLMTNIEEQAIHTALERITAQIESFNARKSFPWTLSTSWGYVYNEAGAKPVSFDWVIEESDARLYEKKRLRHQKS